MLRQSWHCWLLLVFVSLLLQWRASTSNATNRGLESVDVTGSGDCLAVEMVGRMGNLMFQYAALVGLCKARGQSYQHCAYIPSWQVRWSDAEFPLSEFMHAYKLHTGDSLGCRLQSGAKILENGDDSAIKYDAGLLTAPVGTTIKGYLQSWRYFHPHAQQEVYALYREMPMRYAEMGAAFIDRIRNGLPTADFTLIGVHLRLGDKLNNAFYNQWSLSAAYYNKAIELVTSRHKNVALVYFAGGSFVTGSEQRHEDVMWIKGQINTNFTYTFFERSGNHFIAMHALMRCDALITAHSSFSWWAGYLSNASEIVAPRSLFPPGGPTYVMDDYYLPEWSLLDEDHALDRIVG